MKIKKRDVGFFLIGMFTMLVIDVASDWETHKNSFKQGYIEGHNKGGME